MLNYSHFVVLIPLLSLLVLSLVYNRAGAIHLITLGYTLVLSFSIVSNQWTELALFSPILIGTGIISLFLFIFAMTRGNWL